MCIIAVKPQGNTPLPMTILSACWDNNPHGAGFVMYRPGHDTLLIQKGFMTLEALLDALNASAIQEQDTVIYHFRIATSGGIAPANCHPFPVSANVNDLKSLTIACKTAFVHNGVLGKGKKDLSDTQLYVLKKLSRYGNLQGSIPKIEKDTAGSRTAILNADGQLWLTGKWVKKDGYHFSNETYAYPAEWYPYDSLCAFPETCDCCRSKLVLVEWNGILRCEQCGTGYAACQECGTWQPISDMDTIKDEDGNKTLVCFSCSDAYEYDFGWLDGRRSLSLRGSLDRLLRD